MALLREVKDTVYAINGKLYMWRVRSAWRISSYRLLTMCNHAFEYKYGLLWMVKNRQGLSLPFGFIIIDVQIALDIINRYYGEAKYTDTTIHYLTTEEEVENLVEQWHKSVDKI